MVVTDADGVLLWREGSVPVRRRADALGFTEGANWSERMVGSNAIGTALAEGAPVQMFAAEHFVRSHHVWTCTACPVHDPRTGDLLGVVDVSGPAETVHPTTVALVGTAVKLAEASLWRQHEGRLEALRGVAAPLLSGLPGAGLVVDDHGWVAAVTGMPSLERIAEPRGDRPVAIHGVGVCVPEPVPGGWLLRVSAVARDAAHPGPGRPGRRGPSWTGPVAGCTRCPPGTPRCWCCWPPARPGWTPARCPRALRRPRPPGHGARGDVPAAPLAGGLLLARPCRPRCMATGTPVTVRAEMSRLRRALGGRAAGPAPTASPGSRPCCRARSGTRARLAPAGEVCTREPAGLGCNPGATVAARRVHRMRWVTGGSEEAPGAARRAERAGGRRRAAADGARFARSASWPTRCPAGTSAGWSPRPRSSRTPRRPTWCCG